MYIIRNTNETLSFVTADFPPYGVVVFDGRQPICNGILHLTRYLFAVGMKKIGGSLMPKVRSFRYAR